ncbi:MAG TPA: mandelate racemase/muconate lactonizing enzyme family protein [Candidatus Bathyarchaeia archaeon]|nr:mandelate racemase/muconate lactonizing enzyme family protein [Candidatus Bathyarchaeia archaeon]
MRITDVRPVLLTHPYGTEGRRSACLVEVETDAGITGTGETYAGVYVPEVAAAIVELFKPLVLGLDATRPELVYRTAYRATSYFGRTGLSVMVLSAIENAVWDIAGQARGVPVHALLGGAVHDELPMYGSGGPFTMTIPELVAQAADVKRRGLRGFKMRVNFFRYQPEAEAERVAAVREALGPDPALAIDAVQNFNPSPWSVKEAARMLHRLEPFDLSWAEEMLPPFDPQPYAELRQMTSTPISGGEGITTAAQFEQWLRAGAFDLAQPDATIIGGIGEARRACEAAAARGIPVAMHVWGSAPTLAANIHLACATPNCIWVEQPVLGNPLESELFVEPLVVRDGRVQPPTAPGLGVRLGAELRDRYRFVPGSGSTFGV